MKRKDVRATFMAWYAQELERRVLETVYNYCKGCNIEVGALCYDGLFIKKECYDQRQLQEFSDTVYDKLGLRLKFEQKEMEHYKNELENIKEDSSIVNVSQRYLLDKDKLLDDDTPFCNIVNNFWTGGNKILSVKSPYDTGKTQFIKSVLDKYNPTKVLFVSYRITLAYDIEGTFHDYNFKNYKDGDFNADRLINQTESLMKLLKNRETVPKYDLIVIDEIESVLRQFNSPTFRGKAPVYFEVLTFLVLSASKVICLDGDINERTYTFINSIGKNHGYTHVVNNINFNNKTLNFIHDDVSFNNRIIKDLQDNLKLVIPTMSARYGIDLKATLTAKFPSKTILLYIADTDDKEKHKI